MLSLNFSADEDEDISLRIKLTTSSLLERGWLSSSSSFSESELAIGMEKNAFFQWLRVLLNSPV
jgi:hypothetical protein